MQNLRRGKLIYSQKVLERLRGAEVMDKMRDFINSCIETGGGVRDVSTVLIVYSCIGSNTHPMHEVAYFKWFSLHYSKAGF